MMAGETHETQIYFLFTDTGTYLNRLINCVTNQPLNHVSISFDPDLREVYSFGRKRPRNPFIGGFVKEDTRSVFLKRSDCAIYAYELTSEDCSNIKARIAEIEGQRHNYKYNFIGLFGVLLNVEINRADALFCSQFVASVLRDVQTISFHKPVSFITPADIRSHKGMQLLYEGKLEDYQERNNIETETDWTETGATKSFIFLRKVKRLIVK